MTYVYEIVVHYYTFQQVQRAQFQKSHTGTISKVANWHNFKSRQLAHFQNSQRGRLLFYGAQKCWRHFKLRRMVAYKQKFQMHLCQIIIKKAQSQIAPVSVFYKTKRMQFEIAPI